MLIPLALIFSSLLLFPCGVSLIGGSGIYFEEGKNEDGRFSAFTGISFLLLSLFLAFIAGTYWHAAS